ncbi:MAG TPA: ABC transporter ATP-binding protein [Polyangiaceae bacterium]|nr:ABC transporter ATP-binding protein [Polyangiaceae bacterium]
MTTQSPLLQLCDLNVEFDTHDGVVHAVNDVSFAIAPGEMVALVGESGCGKSATSLAIMGLLPKPYGRIAKGAVRFAPAGQQATDLTQLAEEELRRLRGNRMAMIFQDPMTSLNPYLTVEDQLSEVVMLHLGLSRVEAARRAADLLRRAGIPDAERRMQGYPHEFSGGMRQRVMIVMALLCDPQLLIADEPTTALDVTIQAQILDLLSELRRERQLSVLFVTHDLGIVAGRCDRVIVMYAGRVVETGPTREVFRAPAHPYTRALLASVPRVDAATGAKLYSIEGLPPRLDRGPFDACSFAARCPHVRDACRQGEPTLTPFAVNRERRCVVPVGELA